MLKPFRFAITTGGGWAQQNLLQQENTDQPNGALSPCQGLISEVILHPKVLKSQKAALLLARGVLTSPCAKALPNAGH